MTVMYFQFLYHVIISWLALLFILLFLTTTKNLFIAFYQDLKSAITSKFSSLVISKPMLDVIMRPWMQWGSRVWVRWITMVFTFFSSAPNLNLSFAIPFFVWKRLIRLLGYSQDPNRNIFLITLSPRNETFRMFSWLESYWVQRVGQTICLYIANWNSILCMNRIRKNKSP